MITVLAHLRRGNGRLERGALTAAALTALAAIWLGLGFRGLPTAFGGSAGKQVETPLVAYVADGEQPRPHAIPSAVAPPEHAHHRVLRTLQPTSARGQHVPAPSREPASAPAAPAHPTRRPQSEHVTPTIPARPTLVRAAPAETSNVSSSAEPPPATTTQQTAAAAPPTATPAPAPPTTTTTTPADTPGSGLPALPTLPAVPAPPDLPSPPALPSLPPLPPPPSVTLPPPPPLPPPVDPTQQLTPAG